MDYTFKTISRKVLGDLHTPVSIYLKVRDIYPESALLESSDFHGNENSLSYITLVRWQVSESIMENAPLFFLMEKVRLRH